MFINGYVYDIYGVAADMLERWPLVGLQSVDWTEGDVSQKNSGARQQKLLLAEQYRMKQWVGTISMNRNDVAGTPILESSY